MTARHGAPFWTRPLCVAAIALVWGAAHGALRLAASPTVGVDDARAAVFAQALEWGWQIRQPPLHGWLLWSVQQGLGPGMAAALALKYALFALTVWLVHAVARRAIQEPRLAALAALSLSAIYQVGWNLHEGVTHTAVLMPAIAGAWLALLRVCERPGAGRAAALGLAVGAGLLAKHAFLATLAQLALAVLATPQVRRALTPPSLAIAGLVAAAVYAPYALWLSVQGGSLAGAAETALLGNASALPLRLADAAVKPLLFLCPLLPLALLLTPGWRDPPRAAPPTLALLRAAMPAGLAMLLIGALAFELAPLKERRLHALFLMGPVWLWAELAARRPEAPLRPMLGPLAGLAGLVLVLRAAAFAAPEEGLCGRCRPMKPYGPLGEALAEAELSEATLAATDVFVAGNLRRMLPEARVIHLGDDWRPPADEPRACALVWDEDAAPPASAPEGARRVEAAWPHLWRPEGWRISVYGFAALPPGDLRCAGR